jgi:hypothetical protein
MAFTTESIEAPALGKTLSEPSHFDLPVREFVGYDAKAAKPAAQATPKQDVVSEEAPAEVTETPVEEGVTLSSKVSAFARKEQAQRQAAQKLARERAEFAAQIEKAKKFDELQTKLAAKDYSAVEELGVNYDEFVKHELNKEAGKDPAEQRARKLEEEIANIKKAQEEREISDYKQNQALWKDEISRTISAAEKFPEIDYLKSKGQDVAELILQHVNDSFDEDGVELSAEVAAEQIEKALAERAAFYAESPTVKSKAPVDKVLGPPKGAAKTITQTMTTTPRAQSSKPFHLMSESEQLAEAIRRVQAAKLQR